MGRCAGPDRAGQGGRGERSGGAWEREAVGGGEAGELLSGRGCGGPGGDGPLLLPGEPPGRAEAKAPFGCFSERVAALQVSAPPPREERVGQHPAMQLS